jgi:hypothetical protein
LLSSRGSIQVLVFLGRHRLGRSDRIPLRSLLG